MGFALDLETSIAIVCAIGVVLIFCLAAYALSEVFGGRRWKRRLGVVQARAQGIPLPDAVAARSLSRQQSATPKIDRIARRWLPRREALVSRLSRTGRSISVGQYAMVMIGVAALSAIGLVCTTRIKIAPCLLVGLLIGTAHARTAVRRISRTPASALDITFPAGIHLMARALAYNALPPPL